ncbi:hypothetical protein [Haloarchaeobius iranensis]|uniref:hypothetical protein n=1 Tax=Haloarchaeobius iranensis TaxID=996166 RepID=UPI001587BD97|nr:hypothetical protein [Haloarchaeobius iranensis]
MYDTTPDAANGTTMEPMHETTTDATHSTTAEPTTDTPRRPGRPETPPTTR